MKKRTMIIAISLLIAGIWYLGKRKTNMAVNQSNVPDKVSVLYTGPDLMYTGLITKSGDIIKGTMNNDGSLTYTMWGNGIIASSKDYRIKPNNFTLI